MLLHSRFDLLTLGSGEGGCGQNICYHVTAFFNLLTPRVRGGGSAGIIFASMLHVAAPVISFNLICNMIMF